MEQKAQAAPTQRSRAPAERKEPGVLDGMLGGGTRRRESAVESMVKSAARSMGSQVGRAIIRGILGSILRR